MQLVLDPIFKNCLYMVFPLMNTCGFRSIVFSEEFISSSEIRVKSVCLNTAEIFNFHFFILILQVGLNLIPCCDLFGIKLKYFLLACSSYNSVELPTSAYQSFIYPSI